MTIPFKTIICSVLLCVGIVSLKAQTGIVINDAAIVDFIDTTKELILTQSIGIKRINDGNTGRFAIFIDKLTPTSNPFAASIQYSFNYSGIAEEYRLFDVAIGTQLDPGYVSQTPPLLSNNPLYPVSALSSFTYNQSKYFGYWDDRQHQDGMPDADDLFGWVRITRTSGGLVASESATALGGGIIVGGYTQIPEPAVSAVSLGGIALLLAARRSRRQNT